MILNTKPSPRELVTFGLALLPGTILLGLLISWRTGSSTAGRTIWVIGVLLTLLFWIVPPLRRWLFVGMSAAAYPIGWVMSHVVLFLVFWLVVTPIGVMLRALGRDPLARRRDEQAATYWSTHEQPDDQRRYFQQF